MSDELFMFSYPREGVTQWNLFERGKDGVEVCVADLYSGPDNPHGIVSVRQAVREHPRAYFRINVPVAALWQPSCEPDQDGWEKDEAKWNGYLEALKADLERFLNRTLGKLHGMVRTGRFVLRKVRVKLTECGPRPAEEIVLPKLLRNRACRKKANDG